MANPLQSFYPKKLDSRAGLDSVVDELNTHMQLIHQRLNNYAQAFALLKPGTPSGPGSTTIISTGSTTVVGGGGGGTAGVSSFNSQTGAVTYFPSMGAVNNQGTNTSYTTQTQDNGSLIVFAGSSAAAVTLNYSVATPWFTTISNQGTANVVITPSSGLINGASSMTLAPSQFATIYFDGTNWTADTPLGGSGVTSLNSLVGALSLLAGAGVTITPSGTNITIAVSGAGSGFSGSVVGNGYIVFPYPATNPLILQWGHTGTIPDGSPGLLVNFPLRFPTQVFAVVPVDDFAAGGTRNISIVWSSTGTTAFEVWSDGSGAGALWIATGN